MALLVECKCEHTIPSIYQFTSISSI